MDQSTVEPDIYSSDYFLSRCGGVEFFHKFGFKVLKPSMQGAVQIANLKKSDRILDMGCGRGELVANLASQGFDITGTDYSEDAIATAKRIYPEGKFVLVRSDEAIFPSQHFDKIFFLGIIEHLYEHEIEKSLLEIKRILKPGGSLVVTTCTNLLYYKARSYWFRSKLVSLLNKLGLNLKQPSAPRSEEDEQMHINEKHYFSLKKSLSGLSSNLTIVPRPNPKYSVNELYGENLPSDFPIRAKSFFQRLFYKTIVFRSPLNLFLARTYLAIVKIP